VTESVHQETVRIVDAQMSDMSTQMEALDDFVAKARSQNGRFHESQLGNLDAMAENVRESRSHVHGQLDGLTSRVGQLQDDVGVHTENLEQTTAPLQTEVRQPLLELRSNIQSRPLKEYVPTGITPQKRRYEYPSELPQTEPHDGLRTRHRTSKQFTALPFNEQEQQDTPASTSPSKKFVYNDTPEEVGHPLPSSAATPSNTGLREVDVNVARPVMSDANDVLSPSKSETPALAPSMDLDETPEKEEPEQPSRKRRRSNSNNHHTTKGKLPKTMLSKKMAGMKEGRENLPPSGIAGGRRFRNPTSD
jgi:kinesin family protein 11